MERAERMRSKIEVCETMGQFAVMSLLYEVSASPKPGLVDRFNQGAHRDMDFFSFMASTAALPYYFFKCALRGADFQGSDLRELFNALRPLGLEAERAMFNATGGVNTHKGLIFSLGILCAASAWCRAAKEYPLPDTGEICETAASMAEGICSRELLSMGKKEALSNGEKMYRKYGLRGIRGEVEAGFPTVRLHSLPVFRELTSMGGLPVNSALVQTLLHLMAVNDDTNIAARKGSAEVEYVKNYASSVLKEGGMLTPAGKKMLHAMNRDFIERNISPGGSADLLAVTVMLYLLSAPDAAALTPLPSLRN